MPAIGLRLKFFFIISSVIAIAVVSSLILYTVSLKQERLSLIDQQVRETAAILVGSELGKLSKLDFEHADEIISDELGESRIGKFFVLRNGSGDVVFESSSASLLPVPDFSQEQQWFQLSIKGKLVRGLNLKLPRVHDRTLQVGLLIDESFLTPNYFTKVTLPFFGLMAFLTFVISFFLTSYLLRPIAALSNFLEGLTLSARKKPILPKVPDSIMPDPSSESRDEFERMTAHLNKLIDKVNKNYEFSRLWAYQMAHELKTPLSIMMIETENLQKKHQLSSEAVSGLMGETKSISETVNSFLDWAELENSATPQRLFINSAFQFVARIADRLDIQSSRIVRRFGNDFSIVSNPQHLEQLLLNLVQNSLVHTAANSKVTITVESDQIQIDDEGPGMSSEILARLGEPFNRGNSAGRVKGHGLGAAWAISVCRLYGWSVVWSSNGTGTSVVIKFS